MRVSLFAGIALSLAFSQAGFSGTPASVPMWTGTDGTYTYTMVGQSPVTALASPTTTISVQILPVALVFSDGTKLDPTAVDNTCSPAGSALSLLEASPLFNNSTYTAGGVAVGTTQYHDFFQRANFWQYTGPTGVNPNYHLLLSPSPHAVTTLTVPAADGVTSAASCGRLGQVNLSWFDSWLQNTLFPSAGILPTQFAVVLLYNSVTYVPPSSSALILGYHSAYSSTLTGGATQTYAVGDFDTTGNFGTVKDVADLSHEIGEWIDDPLGSNPTPGWASPGQIGGCQTNLEVGDPLSGTDINVTMTNAYVYHLQELAFASWFYHDAPSKGVNGWYSSNGTFKTSAAACPASGAATATTTTLSLSSTTVAAGASVTATVTVKAASGTVTPTGTVAVVTSTGFTLGSLTLSNGTASGTVILPAGTYTVTAEFAGSSTFAASNSAPVSVVSTAQVATTTSLTLSATTVTPATQVTVSIAVKPASGTAIPTGSVSLVTSTGTTLATFALTNGAASGSILFPAGTYTVTAKYAGSGGFTASNSAAVSVVSTAPVPVATTTTLTLSATTVAAGTSVTATIAVKPASGTVAPAGSVTLASSTGSTLATFTLANGAASGSVVLPAGTYTVTAKYAGSTSFAASASSPVSVVSTLSPTTTTLSFSSTALPSGGSDTAAISVKPTSGTGTPTGTVALVSSTGTKIATVTLANGAFSGAVTLPSGSYTVTAQYSGDASFAASSSAAITINPVAVLSLSPATLTFASTTVGTTAAAQTITVKNTGSAAASSLAISDKGTDPSDFSWTTTCGASLAVNASCSIQVSFKPAAKGTRTATLSVGTSTASLTGTGK